MQCWFDDPGKADRNFVLKLEDIFERAVEAVAQRCVPVIASINCPVMRSRWPALRSFTDTDHLDRAIHKGVTDMNQERQSPVCTNLRIAA